MSFIYAKTVGKSKRQNIKEENMNDLKEMQELLARVTQKCILDEMLKKGAIDQQQYYAVCKDLKL